MEREYTTETRSHLPFFSHWFFVLFSLSEDLKQNKNQKKNENRFNQKSLMKWKGIGPFIMSPKRWRFNGVLLLNNDTT